MYIPPGASYWLSQAIANGRTGLPSVIMLHGAGQDPTSFKKDWTFETVNKAARVVGTEWMFKFIVLIPHGLALIDKAVTGPTVGLAPEGERMWNVWPGLMVRDVDDVGFIAAVRAHAAGLLVAYHLARGVSVADAVAWDPDRVYLHAYSNGGGLAFRLANQHVDTYAAIFAMNTSYGGRSYAAGTLYVNAPNPGGTKSISLTLAVGEADTAIPAGGKAAVGMANLSADVVAAMETLGVPTANAQALAPLFRTAAGAIDSFVSYNQGLAPAVPFVLTTVSGLGDIAGGTLRYTDTWKKAGISNPEVILSRDTPLAHTGIASGAFRYFDAEFVWAFFMNHPRL